MALQPQIKLYLRLRNTLNIYKYIFLYYAWQLEVSFKIHHVFRPNGLDQCGTNIQIFKYIRIYLDKYIHLSKYSLIFSKADIFGYSFVIYSYWRTYLDIHSSNIYDSKYIWIFIVSKKWLKMVLMGPKWFNKAPK